MSRIAPSHPDRIAPLSRFSHLRDFDFPRQTNFPWKKHLGLCGELIFSYSYWDMKSKFLPIFSNILHSSFCKPLPSWQDSAFKFAEIFRGKGGTSQAVGRAWDGGSLLEECCGAPNFNMLEFSECKYKLLNFRISECSNLWVWSNSFEISECLSSRLWLQKFRISNFLNLGIIQLRLGTLSSRLRQEEG